MQTRNVLFCASPSPLFKILLWTQSSLIRRSIHLKYTGAGFALQILTINVSAIYCCRQPVTVSRCVVGTLQYPHRDDIQHLPGDEQLELGTEVIYLLSSLWLAGYVARGDAAVAGWMWIGDSALHWNQDGCLAGCVCHEGLLIELVYCPGL